MNVQFLTEGLNTRPTYVSGLFSLKTAHCVAELATLFFEQEEVIRERTNDSLREAALAAEQDSHLLHAWLLQDWRQISLERRQFSIIF
jgi:hypothetical protein